MTKEAKKKSFTKPFAVGSSVKWNWMGRDVQGKIKRIYLKPIEMVLTGVVFKRNGSVDKPAYLVESKAGRKVIKSHTELSKK